MHSSCEPGSGQRPAFLLAAHVFPELSLICPETRAVRLKRSYLKASVLTSVVRAALQWLYVSS